MSPLAPTAKLDLLGGNTDAPKPLVWHGTGRVQLDDSHRVTAAEYALETTLDGKLGFTGSKVTGRQLCTINNNHIAWTDDAAADWTLTIVRNGAPMTARLRVAGDGYFRVLSDENATHAK